METRPELFVDCKGLDCPLPVVKTKRAIKKIEIGQVIEMVATDPGVIPDMEAWERQTRHELLAKEDCGDGTYRFLIKKTH